MNDQKLYEIRVNDNKFSVFEGDICIGSGPSCKQLTIIMVKDYLNCTCRYNACIHLGPGWRRFISYVSGVFAIDLMAGGRLYGTRLCGVTIREIAEILKKQKAKNGK